MATATGGPALLAAYGAGLGTLPRVALGTWPTPLAPAPGLGADLGHGNLWLKDDSRAAPGYGGNKVRKLEYLLAAARARASDAVVTFGAAGSNHVLATAVHARGLGLHCHAVLTDQPVTPWVADTLRWHRLLGSSLHPATGFADSAAIAARLHAAHPRGPDALYDIPWGGSAPLGTLGFVAAGLELADQCRTLGLPAPQAVYLPLGTMGSAVGLALGLRLAGCRTRVVGVQVVPPVVANEAAVATLLQATQALLTALAPAAAAALAGDAGAGIELRGDCLGEGYALPTPASQRAVRQAAEHGLALETTYSGKALAALAADAGRYDRTPGPVIFWITANGQPKPPGLAAVPATDVPVAFRHYLA